MSRAARLHELRPKSRKQSWVHSDEVDHDVEEIIPLDMDVPHLSASLHVMHVALGNILHSVNLNPLTAFEHISCCVSE